MGQIKNIKLHIVTDIQTRTKMVGTRHLYGNLLSRTKFLLKSGALKKEPVWYKAVEKFPPPPCALLTLRDQARGKAVSIPRIKLPGDDERRSKPPTIRDLLGDR